MRFIPPNKGVFMYKALISFSGVISMNAGDVKDIPDTNIAKSLLDAGYIEEIKPAERAKTTKSKTRKRG